MSRYRINSPKVIHQVFETEVVVVNLETGTYYSVEGAGIDIWRMLAAQRTTDEIVSAMTQNDNGSAAANAETIRAFLGQVADEALIVPDENGANGRSELGSLPAARDLAAQPARLRKFTDMRDLLLLDPIHELDEAGWPQRPPKIEV